MKLGKHWGKIFTSNVTIKTGLTNYERTSSGKALIKGSESDLQGILTQYGITPTVGLSFSYVF